MATQEPAKFTIARFFQTWEIVEKVYGDGYRVGMTVFRKCFAEWITEGQPDPQRFIHDWLAEGGYH